MNGTLKNISKQRKLEEKKYINYLCGNALMKQNAITEIHHVSH